MDFIRHGQSEFNVVFDQTGRDPNIPDSPLSAQGRRQVQATAERLSHGAYDMIISSPYTRALQTASILAETVKAPIIVEPLVGERRLYSCDIGTPASRLQDCFPHVDFNGFSGESWWLPFNEGDGDLKKRVQGFESKWTTCADRLLVVSHWYFISAVTGVGADNAQLIKHKY